MREKMMLVAVVAASLAGCGDEDGGGGNKTAEATTATAQSTTAKPSQPKPYRDRVADCVEDVGFKTRDAGNALRVESPGGSLIANIQTFATAAEARRFDAQVEVPHAYDGQGVAVWLVDADDTQRRVVADCLTP